MLTSYLMIVVSVPVVGFIPALNHGAFSLTLRKHRYVEYLRREGTTDFDALSDFLGDLQTDGAASVERVR
jgi:hypothetical protein